MKHLIGKTVMITYHGSICTTYTDMAKKLRLTNFQYNWGNDSKDIVGEVGLIIGFSGGMNGHVGIRLKTHDIVMTYYNNELPFEVVNYDIFKENENFLM